MGKSFAEKIKGSTAKKRFKEIVAIIKEKEKRINRNKEKNK